MKTIVITGGIASGKSSLIELLKSLAQYQLAIFSCDSEIKKIYRMKKVRRAILMHFGPEVFLLNGELNFSKIREIIFINLNSKIWLEKLLHPILRKIFLDWHSNLKKSAKCTLAIVEVPLYFEANPAFDYRSDEVWLCSLSRSTQIQRLKFRSNFEDSFILKIIDSQLTLEKKSNLADRVFWNEGDSLTLQRQLEKILNQIL